MDGIRAFTHTVRLNNTHLGDRGIALFLTQDHVQITDDIWTLNPPSQDNTDITIEMTREWGFHPDVPSTLSVDINGSTPVNSTTSDDGEFLILFSVNDTQYFSVVVMLETGQAWASYPGWENNTLATTDSVLVDIISPSEPIRFHRVSNNDQWDQIGPGSWYKKALQWPLHFEITNDPINDTTNYRCFLPDKTLEITFSSSFMAEQGMSIYIMNEASDNKPFDIHSIEMTYSFTTLPPTPYPTISPMTQHPTSFCTKNPEVFQ